jgi:hypothetical protein
MNTHKTKRKYRKSTEAEKDTIMIEEDQVEDPDPKGCSIEETSNVRVQCRKNLEQ